VGIFRRKRKDHERYSPPPPEPIDPSLVESATAELAAVSERDSEIEERRAKLLKIQKDNALGPRFWAAVGERRA
jgi:hypothetical protein